MTLAWRRYGADVPRIVGTDRALLLEAPGSNLANNPTGEGAVIGTPGTLPTGISVHGVLSLAAVVSQGVFNGVGWTEYSLTASGAGTGTLRYATPSVTSGLLYAGQVFAAWPGAAPGLVTATHLRLGNTATPLVAVTLPINGDVSARSGGLWTANATGATEFEIQFTTSGAGTFSVRSAWNDLNQSFSLKAPILAASGPAAMGSDLLSFSLSSLGIAANGASTWWFDRTFLNTPPVGLGLVEGFISVDDGTVNNAFRCARDAGTSVFLTRALGGAALNATGLTPVPIGKHGTAITIRGDGTARVSIHGVGASGVTGGPVSGLTTVRFNGLSNLAQRGNTQMRRLEYLPYAVSDAQLNTFAADAAAWS